MFLIVWQRHARINLSSDECDALTNTKHTFMSAECIQGRDKKTYQRSVGSSATRHTVRKVTLKLQKNCKHC